MLEMKDILLQFLNEVSKEIKAEQTRQGRVASGKTAQSLEPEATDKVGILYGNISVNVLETGRKGGKVPGGFKSIIYQWMKDKGIFQAESEAKQNSIAYLIARKIKDEGTSLYRNGGKSGVLSNIITERRIDSFEYIVLRRFGREVTEEVITTFAK
jgi:hypothetical protein